MTGYVLSADADLDLDEIWEYIAADSIDAADRRRFSFEALEGLSDEVSPRLLECRIESRRTRRMSIPAPL